MSHAMKALGVASAEEWSSLAWARPADADEEATARRRQASQQMLAIMATTGFTPGDAFMDDAELLITGRMSPEEHRAYLAEKYKGEA